MKNFTFESYQKFLERLHPDKLDDLDLFVTEDILFMDPLHHVVGSEKMKDLLRNLFSAFDEIKYSVDNYSINNDQVFFEWTLNATRKGIPFCIKGVTKLKVNFSGKVCQHIEYWDIASQFYEKIPVLGFVVRCLRKFITKKSLRSTNPS